MHFELVSSNNTNSISSIQISSGENSAQSSDTTLPIASSSKKIRKRRGRGQRGKAIRNNPCNSVGYLRSCPPRTIKQENKLKYHRRISRILGEPHFENSTSWKPNDLHCTACNTSVTSKKQLALHFKSNRHKHNIWNCTPKYCSPCAIFDGFCTEQLWEAHILSRRHKSTISKLPAFKRQLSEYGFTN